MFTNTAFISVLMAVAEIIGAVTFVMTRDTAKRIVLSCFGLGFGLAIVLFDIIPDATTDNPSGWLLLAVGVALGALLMFKAGARGSRTGSLAAVGGMALHNLSEGIMVAAMGPAAGPIVLVGAVVHKLPEGMVALSLMRDFPSRVKATGTLLLAGIIPLGAVITIPERIQQPLLAIAAGGAFPGTIQGTGACRFRRNPPDGHRRYPGRREGRGRDDCGHGPRRTVLPDDGMTARAAPGSAAQPHARRTRDRSRYGRSIFPRFSAAQRAYPESRKDAVTSRPSLLLAIGRSTKHAGQTRL